MSTDNTSKAGGVWRIFDKSLHRGLQGSIASLMNGLAEPVTVFLEGDGLRPPRPRGIRCNIVVNIAIHGDGQQIMGDWCGVWDRPVTRAGTSSVMNDCGREKLLSCQIGICGGIHREKQRGTTPAVDQQ